MLRAMDHSIAPSGQIRILLLRTRGGANNVCLPRAGFCRLFQGEDDDVVPRAQSDTIVNSLRRRGVPHEYHVYAGEGHGWRKSETIEHFYTTIDAFLRQFRRAATLEGAVSVLLHGTLLLGGPSVISPVPVFRLLIFF